MNMLGNSPRLHGAFEGPEGIEQYSVGPVEADTTGVNAVEEGVMAIAGRFNFTFLEPHLSCG